MRRAPRHGRAGFTIIEVVVAMAVAAVFTLSLITLQSQSLLFARNIPVTWEHVNFAQEYMAERPLPAHSQSTTDWSRWKGDPERTFNIEVQTTKTSRTVILSTRVAGTTETWVWTGVSAP